MSTSIGLLVSAKKVVYKTPDLDGLIYVVSVGGKGSDWLIRGFSRRSIPLESAVKDPSVAKIRDQAIEILSKEKGGVVESILKKINKNSANVHWSPVDNKLLIIDMM